jgi:predicted ATPase
VKIRRLVLHRFTSFEDIDLEFAAGINLIIGENGTGKSHLIKLLYAISEAVRRRLLQMGTIDLPSKPSTLPEQLEDMLLSVFQPEQIGRLVKRGQGRRKATIHCEWDNGATVDVEISTLHNLRAWHRKGSNFETEFNGLEKSIFLPTREVLSIFPGFAAAWARRESAFDRTYYDLCVALDAAPIRGARDQTRASLLEPLETALAAKVSMENGRFYLQYPDGKMEAPLVAEGHRKLAMLAYLVLNGSLTKNGFLFWDEPETSMNPKLALLASQTVFRLSQLGVQSFLTTHDYSISSEIALAAEQDRNNVAFFGLSRDANGVVAEHSDALAGIGSNPILDGLADLHEREQALLVREASL